VPEYRGQPGTVVLGGAVPPPQSSGSQSSPVPGTYQMTLAPAGELTSEVVHPVRSVFAAAKAAKAAKTRVEYIFRFEEDVVLWFMWALGENISIRRSRQEKVLDLRMRRE